MKIMFTEPLKVYKVIHGNWLGRETIKTVYDHDIQGHVDMNNSPLDVKLYGDRIRNIITLYTNEDIDEDYFIEYKNRMYKIINKQSTTIIEPIHHIFTLELK